jgi:ribonucleoside-diphosphate reductase alpha chain
MSRDQLTNRRASETFDITFSGVRMSVSLGYYDDGRVGEVFLSTQKEGTPIDVAARDTAVLISLLLQYGCSADIILKSLMTDHAGKPEGIAGMVASIIKEES